MKFQDVLYRLCYCMSSYGYRILDDNTKRFVDNAAEAEGALQVHFACDAVRPSQRSIAALRCACSRSFIIYFFFSFFFSAFHLKF